MEEYRSSFYDLDNEFAFGTDMLPADLLSDDDFFNKTSDLNMPCMANGGHDIPSAVGSLNHDSGSGILPVELDDSFENNPLERMLDQHKDEISQPQPPPPPPQPVPIKILKTESVLAHNKVPAAKQPTIIIPKQEVKKFEANQNICRVQKFNSNTATIHKINPSGPVQVISNHGGICRISAAQHLPKMHSATHRTNNAPQSFKMVPIGQKITTVNAANAIHIKQENKISILHPVASTSANATSPRYILPKAYAQRGNNMMGRPQLPSSVMLFTKNNLVPNTNISFVNNNHPSTQHKKMCLKTTNNLPDATCLKISLSNVVAKLRVNCHLNLRKIATESYDVIYKRDKQKVVMRMREPKCTAYMWCSGKIVCTGSTSEPNSRRSAGKFVKRLKQIGYPAKVDHYKVVNVLATAKMPFEIDARSFAEANKGPNCSYEPELHCAVTYKDPETSASLKVFWTGSITVAGRNVEKAQKGIRNVYRLLKDHYKTDKPNDVMQVYDYPNHIEAINRALSS